MQQKTYDIIKSIVTVCTVAMFFSCQVEKKSDQGYRDLDDVPIAEGYELNLKYTDSGQLIAILKTPSVLDYSNKSFAYFEFPKGIILDIIDKEGKISVVKADYAISYKETGIIDMRGNVDIQTADSTHLKAKQLYWDQSINWVFTDQKYTSYLPDGTVNEADGFDANQDFTILNSRINDGVMFIEE